MRWTASYLTLVTIIALGAADAQTPAKWTGKRVVLKRAGLKIGFTDPGGKQVYLAELTALAYTVLGEQDDFLQVEHRGSVGWFPKEEALLPDDAIAYFTEKARTAPAEDATALAFLGWAYREKKDYPEAVKTYDEVIRRKPAADWFNNRGILYLESKQPDRAVTDFTEALRLKPDFVLPLENRANANVSLGRLDLALTDLNAALTLVPKNSTALFRRAKVLLAKRDADAALKDLDAALEIEPKNVEYLLQRGDVLTDRRQLDKALADYEAAAKLDPKDTEPLLHRAHAYTDHKQYAKALEELEAVLKLAPENVDAQVSRGWNRFMTGRFAEANEDYSAALKAEPKNPSALNCQAWLWATCPDGKFRDGKKAEEFARKAVELTRGKDPTYRDTLAAALAELGRFDEAVKMQEAVVADVAQDPDANEAKERLELYRKKQPYRETIAK
jgi:tetratricopeptide (TPR) repeat protein